MPNTPSKYQSDKCYQVNVRLPKDYQKKLQALKKAEKIRSYSNFCYHHVTAGIDAKYNELLQEQAILSSH